MHTATFVLSTGRCGTQWLAEALAESFSARLRVEHEPLHNAYAPRAMLAAGAAEPLPESCRGAVLAHLREIERTLESRDYLETGHPCWSSVPWLARRLAGRVRIVHLTRHPVPTAFSWLSHQAYAPPLLPHLPVKELLTPGDAGVMFSEYGARWAALTAWEKCLFYWAEVNAFGLAQQSALAVPWLRLRYEELFEASTLAALTAFLGLEGVGRLAEKAGERIDRHRFLATERVGREVLSRHPRITALAARLGYAFDAVDWDAVRARYFPHRAE